MPSSADHQIFLLKDNRRMTDRKKAKNRSKWWLRLKYYKQQAYTMAKKKIQAPHSNFFRVLGIYNFDVALNAV